jgi:phosphoserine phosphatase RsbU/P
MDGQQRHPWLRFLLGILAVLTLAGQILEAERAPQMPALSMSLRVREVASVKADGAADRAGIRVGDEIASIDGIPVSHNYSPVNLINNYRVGESIVFELRRGQQTVRAVVTPPAPSDVDVLMRLALAAVGILTVLIGTLVYFKKPRNLTLIFMGICYGMGFVVYYPYVPVLPGWLLLRGVVQDGLTLILPPLFVHLFLLFPFRNMAIEKHPRLPWLLYLPGMALMLIFQLCRILDPSQTELLGIVAQQGMGLTWILGMGFAFALFVRSYRRAQTGVAHSAMRSILFGTIFGLAPVVSTVLLRQLWPAISFPGDRLAVVAMVMIPFSFGYAIVRHGIFDATHLFRRTLVMTVVGAMIVITYFACYLLMNFLLPPAAEISSLWVSFMSMIIAGFLFLLIRGRMQALLDLALGGQRRDTHTLLYDLGSSLSGITRRDEQVNLITSFVSEALGSECCGFCDGLQQSDLEVSFIEGLPLEKLKRYRFSSHLSRKLARIDVPIERGDFEVDLPFGYLASSDQEIFNLFEVELIVPVRSQDQLQGLLLIGPRVMGGLYGSDDMRLAETIAAEGGMALQNTVLQAMVKEGEDIRRDVDSARDLQQRLLPTELPCVESMEIDGFSLAALGVGGDYYDCFRTPWGEMVFVIGDASGKGVSGAILMANLQAIVRGEGKRREAAERIVERVNTRLCEIEKPEKFITFGFIRIDPLTGRLSYCNAGHTSFLLVRSNGEIEELTVGGMPLGIMSQTTYQGASTVMRSGDMLILYTDGITERWRSEDMFGEDRLRELVLRNRRLSVTALKETVLAAVKGFSPTPLDDDTTMLMVKML